MEYRKIEKSGVSPSLLGFGCMRFPTVDGHIDEQESAKLLKRAMDGGVTYYDTAFPYHDGESEPFVGRWLNQFDRSSYFLATKMPPWSVNSLDDAKRIFAQQLERLQKDYIDFYLLHAMDRQWWAKMLELGVVDYCEQLQRSGKIRHFGFSFHDDFEVFEQIIRYRKWDFCQLQLNYMDAEAQAGLRGYRLAEELGVPVIVMEPIKGGSLANLPQQVTAPFGAIDNATPAAWAMRWVGSLPNVKVILSGMSTMEQVEDNLATFDKFAPLSDAEQSAVENVADNLRRRVQNSCTGCRYCMPCPAGVDIPMNFSLWNNYHIYENRGAAAWQWNHDVEDSKKAKNCIECGKCEAVCPQKISIRADLKRVQADMENISK